MSLLNFKIEPTSKLNKHETLTGKVQLRESRSIFGNRKLIVQVQVKGRGFVPEWGDYAPYYFWIDANRDRLLRLPKLSLNSVLSVQD